MRSVVRTACLLAMIGVTPVYAADYIHAYVPKAKLVGQGRAQVLVWDLYDAKLYAPEGVYADSMPFALELNYLQDLEGRMIADHAIGEIRRFGFKNEIQLAVWHDQMRRIIPDVAKGSSITGIYVPGSTTIFFSEDEEVGRIDDPAFGKEFFRIWFDARTSTPGLRQTLLNLNNDGKGYYGETPENSRDIGGNNAS